jgi:hypothetical protein
MWNGSWFYKNDGDLKAVYNIVVGTNSKLVKEYYILTLLLGFFLNIISVHYGFV